MSLLDGLNAWKKKCKEEIDHLKLTLQLTTPVDDLSAEHALMSERKFTAKGSSKKGKGRGQTPSTANPSLLPFELDNRTKEHIEEVVRMEMENLLHPEPLAATCIQARVRGTFSQKEIFSTSSDNLCPIDACGNDC